MSDLRARFSSCVCVCECVRFYVCVCVCLCVCVQAVCLFRHLCKQRFYKILKIFAKWFLLAIPSFYVWLAGAIAFRA